MKILSFGEILLRLSTPGYTRLFQENNLETSFCGGEANVAVSLSNFGMDSAFVTKVPDNELGRKAMSSLRYFGVDIHQAVYGDGRLGLYYLEKGASQRASKIIYDRKYSAMALATEKDFNWEKIFSGYDWFHFTGITPALSEEMVSICKAACKKAQKQNMTVSCDLNYRAKLWDIKTAQKAMAELMPYVDVCIGNEEDAVKMLNLKIQNTDVDKAVLSPKGYCEIAGKICEQFGCGYVAFSLRESYSASKNGWSGMLYSRDENKVYFSKKYDIQIVDRVGSGDSFAAGIIYGLSNGMERQQIVEFAVAASCLKHTIEGDFNRVSVDEVMELVNGCGNGRVQR